MKEVIKNILHHMAAFLVYTLCAGLFVAYIAGTSHGFMLLFEINYDNHWLNLGARFFFTIMIAIPSMSIAFGIYDYIKREKIIHHCGLCGKNTEHKKEMMWGVEPIMTCKKCGTGYLSGGRNDA